MNKFALFFFILISQQVLTAQEIARKPKVGLVLSGGGAKGFAHVGVLKVIEAAGVKIDFIGGTSMGAVIGGLYASGYNATQIDSIVKVTNFDNLLLDAIPRNSKSFYEKRNDELYALILPFNKLKIGVPQSLSKGMFNYNLFNELTFQVRHVRDFSKLPIPFLCVATDIELGEQVVLKKGVLAQAMFASSALPSVFSPVIIDGKFLIDGGITNNYPIEEVRKMGADIIIGVDVQNSLKDRGDLKDASKILFQITNLEMIRKMEVDSKKTDIYIKPDIKDYGAVSFEKAAEIIQKGEEAAFSVYEKIALLGNSDNPYTKPKLKVETDSLHIKEIIYNNLTNYSRHYIEGKLKFKSGAKISRKDLESGINTIDATHNFGAITYSLDANGDGDNLVLNFIENPIRTYLKFGLHFDGLYKSGVLINLTNRKNIFKNDVASLDFIVGDNMRYNVDYYIDNGYNLSFGFKSSLNQFNKNVTKEIGGLPQNLIQGVNSINVDLLDLSNQIYIQSIFAQKFLVGTGIENKFVNIQSETIPAINPILDRSNYTSIFANIKYDSFNDKYFPTKGWYFSSSLHNYLFSSDYNRKFQPFSIVKADFGIATKIFKKTTLKVQADGGFTIGDGNGPFFDFVLGGYGFIPLNNIKPFYGYDFLSLAGNSYLKTTATIEVEIFKKNHVNFSANYANIGTTIFDSLQWISLPKYSGYALGYGLETVVGPIEVKYSWSPENNKGMTWFSMGFWF